MDCDSVDAVYEPSINASSYDKYDHIHELHIRETGADHMGFAEYSFFVTTIDKTTGKKITELELSYGCTKGPPNCVVSYEFGGDARKVFNMVTINSDLTQNTNNIRPWTRLDAELPKLIVIPNLSRAVYYNQLHGVTTPSVRYYTDEKVTPTGFDVWKFKECVKQ